MTSKGNPRSNENEEALRNFYDQHAEKKKAITIGKMLEVFEEMGVLPLEDPRMKDFMNFISNKGGKLTKDEFIKAAGMCGDVVVKAVTGTMYIQNFPELKTVLKNIFDICKSDDRGKLFFVNLALPRSSHDAWEASLFSVSGRAAYFGEGKEKFTIQAVIKPIIYALAVELLGVEEVQKIVGMTYHYGKPNDIDSFDIKGIPKNPNINTGGIVLCAYIRLVALKNKTKAQVFDYILQFLRDLAGGKYVSFNNISFMAEKESLSTNEAILFHLRRKKCLPENATLEDLNFYYATCSFEVTTQSLSVMGATIANYGTNPITGMEVLKPETCKYTMAMMQYCTPTPAWLRDVGLPTAKGASGGFLILVPDLFALALFSPKINKFSTSYRGISFCKAFAYHYNLNVFNVKSHMRVSNEDDKPLKVFKPCPWQCVLYTIAARGTPVDFASMMSDGTKPCQTNFMGRNLLHDAAAAGNMRCVSFLMQLCPHMIEKKDSMGFTPLDDAKFFKHEEIVEYLNKWISLRTGTPV